MKRPRRVSVPELDRIIKAETEAEIHDWYNKILLARDYLERVNVLADMLIKYKTGGYPTMDTIREVVKRGHLYEELKLASGRMIRTKNPYPQVCHLCGSVIYSVWAPIACPKCGKKWVEETDLKVRRSRMSKIKKVNPSEMRKVTGSFTCARCGKMIKDKYLIADGAKHYHLKCFQPWKKPNPVVSPKLYQSFHGASPIRLRKVFFEPPPKGESLIKIGRLSRIDYIPENPSKRAGTEYYQHAGDLGHKVIRSNAILCTNQKGNQLYIVKETNSEYPKFTERGIIG